METKKTAGSTVDVKSYASAVIPQMQQALQKNEKILRQIAEEIVAGVCGGQSLFVFGSGHSSLLPLELYHRAGGPSFLIPIVGEYLMPQMGPQTVRLLERSAGAANALLRRAEPRRGEMLWVVSQSGINPAVVDLALEAKRMGLRLVAFTSLAHSQAVPSRHPSGKKLYEVCDLVVDTLGPKGDAAVQIQKDLFAGPVSGLMGHFLAHSILVSACARLEETGVRCVYTSVNTPEGEDRNLDLEKKASARDPLLR